MTIKHSQNYDLGKAEDLRALKKLIKRAGHNMPPILRARLVQLVASGKPVILNVPDWLDPEIRQRNRRTKRRIVKKSRRANRSK